MGKKPLIVVSFCAVVLLVLGSLSTVVGYQTVETSQQNLIKERINQRELLFQTICDIANNKEIQRIILKSQISRGISPPSEFPVVTISQLRKMYILGVLLSRFTRTSRMQSMIGKYQFDNQEMQKEINAVIEKSPTLNAEIMQLSTIECDCENDTTNWNFPILCILLSPLVAISLNLAVIGTYIAEYISIFWFPIIMITVSLAMVYIFISLYELGSKLNCFWYSSPYPL